METNHVIVYCGEHLSLGLMQREYVPLMMSGVNDLEVTRGILLRPPIATATEYEWIEELAKKQNEQVFAILLHEPNSTYRYIGHTGLHQITWPDGFAKTGSVILDRGAHGKGYGTEAKLLLLYHAFFVKGLRKVTSDVKAFNGHSLGHLIKCGYQIVGRHKNHHFDQGTYVDSIMLEVFRSDFEPIWRKYQESKTLPRLTPEQKKLMHIELAL